MQGILTDVTALVTESVGWVGQYVTVIMNNDLLELFVITAFVGTGVGLIKRLIRL